MMEDQGIAEKHAAEFYAAVVQAINGMGLAEFKRTSFFMSNRKLKEQNKAATETCKPPVENANCGA